MYKLYSRPRIKIPDFKFNKKINNRNTKKVKCTIIIIIAILIFCSMYSSITPIFEKMCKEEVKSLATIITNNEATEVMKDYEYEDLITIYRDKNDTISMIKTNIIPINKIISDIPVKIQEQIDQLGTQQIKLTLGSFLGSKLLAGVGPQIPIKVNCIGNVETNVRSEFMQAGINQTLHRLYLDIECNVSIVLPYKQIEEKIVNQVVLAENIIVGEVPSAYLNVQ